MPFEQQENITKIGIEDYEIRFFSPGPGNSEGIQAGELSYQVLMSNSNIEVVLADLLLRLTDDAAGLIHLANLQDLRDYIRVRLNAEALP